MNNVNKIQYILLILISIALSCYAGFSLVIKNNNTAMIKDNEIIVQKFHEDIDGDSKPETIVITKHSPEPFVHSSNLYIKDGANNLSVELVGLYSDIELIDLNNDDRSELVVYLLSGKLLTIQVFSYDRSELSEYIFKDKGKKINIWSSQKPIIEDLDSDKIFEIITVHTLRGERLSETVTLKKYFRWNGEFYEKYDEEKIVEDNEFQG